MTQFLKGNICFREYLCKYGHDHEVNSSFCGNGNENAEHIFVYCHRFEMERELIETMIDERVTPDNIVSHMLRSVDLALCQNVDCKGDAGIEKDGESS